MELDFQAQYAAAKVFGQPYISEHIYDCAFKISQAMNPDGSTLYLGVLRGGYWFTTHLTDCLPNGRVEFIIAHSYEKDGHRSELTIDFMPTFESDEVFDNIIIIDDICDSGQTLKQLKEKIQELYPEAKVLTAALVQKVGSPNPADFAAIQDTTNTFYYGCGMDKRDGTARNCVSLCAVDPTEVPGYEGH